MHWRGYRVYVMDKKIVTKYLPIWLLPFVVLLLQGCHSSRHTVKKDAAAAEMPARKPQKLDDTPEAMGRELVDAALKWIGTRYRYGGDSRNGTDCSGLVMRLYSDVCAVKIPRTTSAQHDFCTRLKRKDARPGDLVFFGSSKSGSSVSHVGLYIGKGEMIHASSSQGVVVSDIEKGYWADRFKGAGRVDGAHRSWAMARGGKGKGAENRVPASVPLPEETTVQNTEVSVDLLDVIINAKVDSIFSEQFMD